MNVLILVRCSQSYENAFMHLDSDDVSFFPSYYGEVAPSELLKDEFSHHFNGGKWSGIHDFFENFPELLERYEYFWFVDDDIETNKGTITKFLEIVREQKFQLAQPALSPKSYWAHRITLVNRRFSFRNSNFVELMMPIMNRDFLLRVLPLFKGRDAAMGVDFFWQQLADNPESDVAIVDATPMRHSRPRRSLLSSNMSSMDRDIFEERERTFDQFAIQRQSPVVVGGERRDGVFHRRRLGMLGDLLLGLREISEEVENPSIRALDYVNLVIQQTFGRVRRPAFSRSAYDDLVRQHWS